MKMYKNLSSYLGLPDEGENQNTPFLPQELIGQVMTEVLGEDLLPFHERFILDLTSNREVFQSLGFNQAELQKFSFGTGLLPREILGINSLKLTLTHDPCMIKLADHIRKLSDYQRIYAMKTIQECAFVRGKIECVLRRQLEDSETIKSSCERVKEAVHDEVCGALLLPLD